MRIIRGYDYWDGVGKNYSSDYQDITIVRDSDGKPSLHTEDFRFPKIFVGRNRINLGLVLYCGQAYPYVCHDYRFYNPVPPSFFYNSNLFIDFIKSKKYDITFREMKNITNWYNSFTDVKLYADFLIQNKAAFAIIKPNEYRSDNRADVYLNAAFLEKINFFEIKTPTEVYMDVLNWCSGVLTQNKQTIKLSNEVMIQKAGFDKIESFRHRKK